MGRAEPNWIKMMVRIHSNDHVSEFHGFEAPHSFLGRVENPPHGLQDFVDPDHDH